MVKCSGRTKKAQMTPSMSCQLFHLGGYVKMVDEREGEVQPQDLPYAFNRQPLWARTAIVVAGPAFNLMLAIFSVLGCTGIR